MAYSVVLGDKGPKMTLTISADGFTLSAVTDTCTLKYRDPDDVEHSVALTITDAPTGACERTWVTGDLPAVGPYVGLVVVTRSSDTTTFPRSFPNDGTKVIWWVNDTI